MGSVREYSYELNPATVERAGLRPALDRLGRAPAPALPREPAHQRGSVAEARAEGCAAVYQILQEAVENAVQHSGCSAIEIAVKSTRTATFLEVTRQR